MIIDGKKIADELLDSLETKHKKLSEIKKRKAKLSVILVGDNEASKIYVRNKEKACEKVGIITNTIILDKNISKEDLIKVIEKENNDKETDGILLQLPLTCSNFVGKDVDGFSPVNIGKLILNKEGIRPCTVLAVVKLLEAYNIKIEGADVVIIGRSNIVGKPLNNMLMNMSATVQVCHSKTKNIDDKIANADILICAAGYPNLINKTHKLKKGVCLIDVGINRVNGKICGDINNEVLENNEVSYITPVPKGVGPMTVAYLVENVLKIFEMREI